MEMKFYFVHSLAFSKKSFFFMQVPDVPASSELFDSVRLFEMKKFVATLITTAMEYQQILEK